jgi:hypothetical protein
MPAVMTHATPFTVQADLDLGGRMTSYLVARDADVDIREGEVPECLEGDGPGGVAWQLRGSRILLKMPNGLRYLVEDGRRILYQRDARHAHNDVALFLLGSAWSALCYQRGLIALHASAITGPGGVYALAGSSGAGKSILAAALAARGRGFFADDVLVVDPAPGDGARCFGGHQALKLWSDSIALAGAERGEPVRSVEGFPKFFAAPRRESEKLSGRLASLIVLHEDKRAEAPRVEALTGVDAVRQLTLSLYRPEFGEAILGRRLLFEGIAALARRISIARFSRRRSLDEFDAATGALDRWIGQHG